MNYFPIRDLRRAEYNPRMMPDQEMQSLMKSIETHGFCEPIVVNVNEERWGVIVGGHQRLTAVEKLIAKGVIPKGIIEKDCLGAREDHQPSGANLTIPVPWIPCFEVDLTLEAEKQLNVGLNKIHGKFEEEKLYELISEMRDSPTITSTGFSESDIASILDRGEQTEKTTETNSIKAECGRCLELKLQVLGHAKRSGHPIGFDDHADNENDNQ